MVIIAEDHATRRYASWGLWKATASLVLGRPPTEKEYWLLVQAYNGDKTPAQAIKDMTAHHQLGYS